MNVATSPSDKTPQHPVPTNFDPVAEIYDETREKLSEKELAALATQLRGSKTLEIAVGTGRLTKPLQGEGIDIAGIDISTRMLNRARAKGTTNLFRGDVTQLPFRTSSFDNILTVHFLHLIPDWTALIREVTRVAKHMMIGLDTRTKSVTSDSTSGNHSQGLHDLYLQRLEKKGFLSPIRPHGELRLADKVKPIRTQVVDTFAKNVSFDKALDLLEKKTWAITWRVPDQLHREIVGELRTDLSGKSMEFSYESMLLAWKVDDLARAEPYL